MRDGCFSKKSPKANRHQDDSGDEEQDVEQIKAELELRQLAAEVAAAVTLVL